MNANELMLGNYVMYANQLHVVVCVDQTEVRISRGTGKGNFIITNVKYSDEELQAISLAEQWILDFGFKKIDNRFELDGENFKITIFFYDAWHFHYDTDTEIVQLIGFPKIHELQNLVFSVSDFNLQLVE